MEVGGADGRAEKKTMQVVLSKGQHETFNGRPCKAKGGS